MVGVFALVVAACSSGGDDDTTTTAPSGGGNETAITLVGQNISFDQDRLTVAAGQQVTITFENRDSGVPHNLRINGPSGPIATEIEGGPVTQTLAFTIDAPGTYEFLCEVHPSAMVGDLVVEG
jgi:plastocyanin